MTGVKCNSDTLCLCILLGNIVGKSLGRTANYVFIHSVGTGTDDTSQSGCTKLKILVESLFYLLVIILDGKQFILCCFVKIWI